MTKQRDISIDILKFFAALLITNSHIGFLYPDGVRALSTGGAIGDVLFFFCSGYTLFLSSSRHPSRPPQRGGEGKFKMFDGFLNWYKRRINRIYPTVFAWALMSAALFGNQSDMLTTVLSGGGWFVSCIMIYYVVLWVLKRMVERDYRWLSVAIALTMVVTLVFYFGWGTASWDNCIYGETKLKWVFYFMYMLMGAMCGMKNLSPALPHSGGVLNAGNLMSSLLLLLIYTALYYAFAWFKNKPEWDWVQLVSLLPLAGVAYEFWMLCRTEVLKRCYESRYTGWVIKFVGGLCLEIYLVQFALMHLDWVQEYLVPLFPVNLLFFFLLVLLTAYMLRCLARIWLQTFKDGEYDWRGVVSND